MDVKEICRLFSTVDGINAGWGKKLACHQRHFNQPLLILIVLKVWHPSYGILGIIGGWL